MNFDGFGRGIEYLRVSVTDNCNLRCVYCLPQGYSTFTPKGRFLTDRELARLLTSFSDLGISKIRITGGEPLLRPGLPELIEDLSASGKFSDISLSTNGILLAPLAERLKAAGLRRINISLDTLDPEKFARITRRGNMAHVLEGIRAAARAGLSPLKINVVLVRGENEDEIPEFVRWTEREPVHVRFIEMMPMGETGFFSNARRVSHDEILERSRPLEPLAKDNWPKGFGPARYFKRPGALGTVGIISALGCNFCSSCNRMRLSADGMLYPCLDDKRGVDLKTPLRNGAGKNEIKNLILEAVEKKPERHFMVERALSGGANPRHMSQIGG